MIGVGIGLTQLAVRRAGLAAETVAWVAAVVGNGGTVSANRTVLVNNLITSMKAFGIWDLLDRIWLFAAENNQSARTCLKSLVLATEVNAPTFTTDRGYTGNGTTSYIDSLYVPSTDGVNLTQNNGHISAYIRTSRSAANASVIVGVQDTTPAAHEIAIYPRFTGNVVHMRMNEAAAAGPDQTDAQGLWLVTRADGSTKSWNKNATQFSSTNTATVSVPQFKIFICAKSQENVGSGFSTDECAAVTIGGHLNATRVTAHRDIIETYMDAIGAGVL